MNDSPLDFIKEQKLVFQLPEGKVTNKNYTLIKAAFSEDPMIIGNSISSSVPGRSTYNWLTWPSNEKLINTKAVSSIEADQDFMKLYGLQLIAGEPFTELSQEQDCGVLINQAAISTFGWGLQRKRLKKSSMIITAG